MSPDGTIDLLELIEYSPDEPSGIGASLFVDLIQKAEGIKPLIQISRICRSFPVKKIILKKKLQCSKV